MQYASDCDCMLNLELCLCKIEFDIYHTQSNLVWIRTVQFKNANSTQIQGATPILWKILFPPRFPLKSRPLSL